ncbi:probable mitochondrial glutathione transporter SLC25A40 isoform X2 [Drosophila biarmipes]|uniref:probable mitochondrial glutathione transporter SLC25A40 isoform X2 n=1 Tax=Drosophila biarmipes TaxID=125945 RepID=UPI0021CCC5E2|nr:probable mitochondrial glutathione transporter SLC25A40 isoform X2 [Drosophila biarmipes]
MPPQLECQDVRGDEEERGRLEYKEMDPLRLTTLVLSADPRYRIKPMQQVVSALVGGLITTFVVTPLEVVKTRVQTQHAIRQRATVSKLCCVFHNGLMTHVCRSSDICFPKPGRDPRDLRPLRGAMDAFVKIVCTSGLSGLWAGLSPTLVSALPSTIIYFVTYEYLKNSLSQIYLDSQLRMFEQSGAEDEVPGADGGDPLDLATRSQNVSATAPVSNVPLPYYVPMASGICSRTIVVTAITPIEMVRIKMQSEYMTYSELWRVLRSLIRQHGILGLWRGWPPTVMRDAPFSGTYWAAYEAMKRAFSVAEPSFLFSFFTGAISGAVATFVTMPFDLITTHTQIELGQDVLYEEVAAGTGAASGTGAGPRKQPSAIAKPSMFSRLRYIYRQQGVRGLYVGVVPRMLRVVPACAIMISTFEYSKSFFFHYNLDLQEADIS